MRATQREFARAFGVGVKAVKRWEHGRYAPRIRHRRTLGELEREYRRDGE
jgi:DNA-binding transcriptional regulator YiaG